MYCSIIAFATVFTCHNHCKDCLNLNPNLIKIIRMLWKYVWNLTLHSKLFAISKKKNLKQYDEFNILVWNPTPKERIQLRRVFLCKSQGFSECRKRFFVQFIEHKAMDIEPKSYLIFNRYIELKLHLSFNRYKSFTPKEM